MIGRKIGPYEILAKLGEGGMGEVYRATDTNLKRSVAIKVLPPMVAGDVDRLARFQREAELLATFNHPNIGAIYGFEKTSDITALVMELIEGEDLSERIARGAIPLDEALPIAKQFADALEAAHEHGIIHRDLKPANIKLRADGTVKVLDFGLAKALDPPLPDARDGRGAGAAGPSAIAPTMTSPAVTAMGVILGTAAYMSPEQAKGRAVDKRADIWAFGAVLYEMLTGTRAFKGDDVSETLASVLRDTPDLAALPASVPPKLRMLLARCLDRDVKTRLRDIGEARVLLGDANALKADASAVSAGSTQTPRSWVRDPRSIVTIAVAVIAVAAAVWLLARPAAEEADSFPARIEISGGGPAALSPDGHTVAFTGRPSTGTGTAQLYVRRLDQLTPRAIPGTEKINAGGPIFSPDGREILFVADRHMIMRAPLDGAPVPVADIGDADGGLDWSASGEIVAGSGVFQGLKGLMRVSAGGGPLREFTKVDAAHGEFSHQWPRILADGKTVLFTIWRGSIDQAELAATSLDSGNITRLNIVAARALDVVDGQLVYVQHDGVAMAVPFDVASLRPTGTAIRVQNGITGGSGATNLPRAFVSHAGGLIFATGQPQRRLVWVDAGGRVTPALNDVRGFSYVRLSPDERQAAVTIDNGNTSDIWVLNFASGGLTRVTSTGQSRNPSWSPDGRRVFYTSTHGGRGEFWWQPIDASGPAVKAGVPPHNPWWTDVSPDGQTVIFNAFYAGPAGNSTWNLETLSLKGDGPHDVREFVATPNAAETMARFSPDGSLVAYLSDDSGRYDVYVRPFSESGSRVLIAEGNRRPVWSRDGTRLYFFEGRQVMSASIARQPSLHVTSRQKLFDWNSPFDLDVAKDGRFLMIDQIDDGQSLVVVPNWRSELHRLTSGNPR